MKAIMLAAGKGTRCYPLTYLYPKLMLQVGGLPLLEYMISWFAGASEIEKLYIVMNQNSPAEGVAKYIQYRGPWLEKIVDLFSQLGYRVEYTNPDLAIEVIQAGGRGTGGDLRSAIETITKEDALDEDFIVCNADYIIMRELPDGDLCPQLGLMDIVHYHRACKQALGAAMTVALVPVSRKDAGRFGVAHTYALKGFHFVRGFVEKPDIESISQDPLINAGVYVIDRDFILSHLDKYLPDGPETSLERMLLSELATEPVPALAAYPLELYRWFDVGTLEQLVKVNICVAQEGKARVSSLMSLMR